MQCAESLRVQAYFDDEVDSVTAADIERHMEHCADCRSLMQDLEQLRAAMQRDLTHLHAPALRSRLSRALDQEGRPGIFGRLRWPQWRWPLQPFWVGTFSGGFATAVAAVLAVVIWAPRLSNPLTDDLVGAHLRSLMADHLIDVVSTDRHTVKPWFAGHTDVSPVVADFEPQGYRLIGGRADYLDHQRAAVVVYQHGPHVINVFSWADSQRGLPANATRNGYHLMFWKSGDLAYCAVSDSAPDELRGLVRLLQGLDSLDARDSKH